MWISGTNNNNNNLQVNAMPVHLPRQLLTDLPDFMGHGKKM
jgi:hypothetical protein